MARRVNIGVLTAIPNVYTRLAGRFAATDLACFGAKVSDRLKETGLTSDDVLRTPIECKGEVAKKIIGDCNVFVADPDLIAPFVYRLDPVEWIQSTWDGVDAMTKFIDHQKPYPTCKLTRFSNFGHHMAEYVIGHIIARERSFKESFLDQAAHKWADQGRYRLLSNLTIGLLGLGQIGSAVARVAKAFGMNVVGIVSREVPKDKMCPFVDEYYFSLQHLPEVLRKSDYVCNTLPQTPKTNDILTEGMLENCKEKKGVLINIGRGNIISEVELVKALNYGWIGGAVLDVFEKEPLQTDSQLWDFQNVTITPHSSGKTFDYELEDFFIKNFLKFVHGEALDGVVDFEKGY